MRSTGTLMAVLAACALATTAAAQQTTEIHAGRGGSPHVRTDWKIDGAAISITYGRPYMKGRPPASLMPPGREWRTGADEATTLVTDRPLTIGGLQVPAGTYTLYTVPGEREWQLVVSKKTGQWGVPYPAGADLGRTGMSLGTAQPPVEQLTISIDDTAEGATLRIEWGPIRATVPFKVN